MHYLSILIVGFLFISDSVVLGIRLYPQVTSQHAYEGVPKKDSEFQIHGHTVNYFRDWVEGLPESVDITDRAFHIMFQDVPKLDAKMTMIYEQSVVHNGVTGEPITFKADVHIRHTHLETTIVPSVFFPEANFANGKRLILISPVTVDQVTMLDPISPSEVKMHRFSCYYHKLQDWFPQKEDLDSLPIVINESKDFLVEVYTIFSRPSVQDFRKKWIKITSMPKTNADKSQQLLVAKYGFDNFPTKLFNMVSKEIASPSRKLFECRPTGLLHVVPHSEASMRYTTSRIWFSFVGRVIGIAILNRIPLNLSFSPDIIQAISRKRKQYSFITASKGLFLGISAQVEAQIDALCSGLWEIIPRKLLSSFDEEELGWLIGGRTADYTVDELKNWTQYENKTFKEPEHIKWFWEYVRTLSVRKRQALLEIMTCSPHLPSIGFDGYDNKLSIRTPSIETDPDIDQDEYFPSGSNQFIRPVLFVLHIPSYSSESVLVKRFNEVIEQKIAQSKITVTHL